MRQFCVAIALAALTTAGFAQPSAAAELTPAVKQDVRCFVLFLIAAGTATEDESKHGASVGVMYYFGKLRIEAPTLSLADAIRDEAAAFENNPQAEAIGEACDSELQERGSDLMNLGEELDKAEAQTSISSSS